MVLRTVDELGRVVIPGVLRDMLDIDVKGKVSLEVKDGALILRPVDMSSFCPLNESKHDPVTRIG